MRVRKETNKEYYRRLIHQPIDWLFDNWFTLAVLLSLAFNLIILYWILTD